MAELGLPAQSCFARKETLYSLVLDYLNRGQAWEFAVDVCRELAEQYEYTSANYTRLANLLVYQANLFTQMATVERAFPSYFLVGFVGPWPISSHGKFFVYRGLPDETLAAFSERMQQLYPRAGLVRTTSPFELNATEPTLVITSLEPNPDRSSAIFTSPDAPPLTRAYAEHSGLATFSFERPVAETATPKPRRTSDAEDAHLWVEKTYLRCEEALPSVLRRSQVVHASTVSVSPLEKALDDVNRKTEALEMLDNRYAALGGSKVNTNRLAMALNAAVDAPVDAGIPYVHL